MIFQSRAFLKKTELSKQHLSDLTKIKNIKKGRKNILGNFSD
jgi:hypothetical protein